MGDSLQSSDDDSQMDESLSLQYSSKKTIESNDALDYLLSIKNHSAENELDDFDVELVNTDPRSDIKVTSDANERIIEYLVSQPNNKDFQQLCLKGVVLEGKTFEQKQFGQSNLSCCTFKNMKFIQCDFTEATLAGSIFLECDFTEVDMNQANPGKAQFIKCQFTDSIMQDSQLKGARIDNCQFISTKLANLRMCDISLTSSSYEHCLFDEGVTYQSTLSEVTFKHCKISLTQLILCKINQCKFDQGELTQVTFNQNQLYKTLFKEVGLTNCGFSDENAQIKACCFESVNADTNQMARLTLDNLTIQKGHWQNNDFTDTIICNNHWEEVQALGNSMVNVQFNDSCFKQVNFSQSNLMGTEYKQSHFINCQFDQVVDVYQQKDTGTSND